MKYKLINKITKEEHLCDKVTIDRFDYYVNDGKIKESFWCYDIALGIFQASHNYHSYNRNLCKKIIATNNPKIDIPKVVDEVDMLRETLVETYLEKIKDSTKRFFWKAGFKHGYNKSQETHPNSDKDMIEFTEWVAVNYVPTTASKELKYWQKDTYQNKEYFYSTQELFQIWKEQQPKIVYYET